MITLILRYFQFFRYFTCNEHVLTRGTVSITSIGVITAGSGNEGKPDEDPPPVNGDSDPSVVKLWGEISPYPEMADGVSPPPNGPNGGLLLNVVRDWDGVAFGESE